MASEQFRLDVLQCGLGDDTNFREVVSLAVRKYAADKPAERVRDVALDVVDSLVLDGLVDVGVLVEGGRFVPRTSSWTQLAADVRAAFDDTLDGDWAWWFWLRPTPAGRDLGNEAPSDYDPFEEDWRTGG